jgi:glycosyltransferase involved in cell wall biosynthesis
MGVARRLAFSGIDAFAANSIDGLAENIAQFGADPARSRRVHNILDLDWLASQSVASDVQDERQPNAIKICVVGRLDSMKLVDTVIRAAATLPEGISWELHIAGAGPAEAALRSLSASLGVSSRVRFVGWLDNPHPLMASCDVFVLPSQFEGFSNSLMEALALRIPSISSLHSSDVAELVRDGVVLGFPPGDANALRDALESLFRDQSLRAQLRERGANYVMRMKTKVVMNEYEGVILSAIESRVRSQGKPSPRAKPYSV